MKQKAGSQKPHCNSMKTIAIDIDDVLVPHFQDLITWYNNEYGTKLELKDNYSDDNTVWGTETEEEAIRRVQRFYSTKDFLHCRPFHEAHDVLKNLSNRYKLVVITARDTIIEAATREWLEQHFEEVFSDIHFSAHYSLNGESRTKADICLAAGADYLIDDTIHHAIPAARIGVTVLLFGEYPWNRENILLKNIIRAKDWNKVQEYFDELDGV
jgi:uncharacterized HAD superfamily protein